jgi:integrase
MKDKKSNIKESTYYLYNYSINRYIVPKLGHIKLCEMDKVDIESFISDISESNLSIRTIKNIVTLLKSCLIPAIEKKLVNIENLDLVIFPGKHVNKIKVLSDTDQNMLVKSIYSNINYKTIGILICLNTGIRIGEICGLQWGNIDLKNRIIYIRKTIQRISLEKGTKIIINTPKTRTSFREIPISNTLYKILKELYNSQQDIYLLSNKTKYLEPRAYRKYFKKFLEKNNIANINFHALRHTFATRCIEHGIEYKLLSEILGHSTIDTTLNLYVHPQMRQKRISMEKISRIFGVDKSM